MEYSEDQIALAAEYALGTLDTAERAQAEAMMSLDKDFAGIVQAWEFRLGALNQMVGSVEPSPELWEKIRTAVGLNAVPQAPLVLPESSPPVIPADTVTDAEPVVEIVPPPPPSPATPASIPAPAAPAAPEPVGDTATVARLSGRVRAYRSLAVAMTAIAAALLALLGVQVAAPGLLPGLGGEPRTRVVEVAPTPAPAPPTPAPSAQYVALLQGAAGGPAFILTVDAATRNFTVRKLGAPPIDPAKNYELWLISERLQNRPRSLGVIGASDFTARPVLAGYDSDVINGATYAVTIEQAGGSPDGAPHAPPVFAGKLIETVPAPTQ